jgi:hypothetical protein
MAAIQAPRAAAAFASLRSAANAPALSRSTSASDSNSPYRPIAHSAAASSKAALVNVSSVMVPVPVPAPLLAAEEL